MPSPLVVDCPGCAERIKPPLAAAGKKVKCPTCGYAVPVPALPSAPPGGSAGRGVPVTGGSGKAAARPAGSGRMPAGATPARPPAASPPPLPTLPGSPSLPGSSAAAESKGMPAWVMPVGLGAGAIVVLVGVVLMLRSSGGGPAPADQPKPDDKKLADAKSPPGAKPGPKRPVDFDPSDPVADPKDAKNAEVPPLDPVQPPAGTGTDPSGMPTPAPAVEPHLLGWAQNPPPIPPDVDVDAERAAPIDAGLETWALRLSDEGAESAALLERLLYLSKSRLERYMKTGLRDKRWDDAARKAIGWGVLLEAGLPHSAHHVPEVVLAAAVRAMKAGCPDPGPGLAYLAAMRHYAPDPARAEALDRLRRNLWYLAEPSQMNATLKFSIILAAEGFKSDRKTTYAEFGLRGSRWMSVQDAATEVKATTGDEAAELLGVLTTLLLDADVGEWYRHRLDRIGEGMGAHHNPRAMEEFWRGGVASIGARPRYFEDGRPVPVTKEGAANRADRLAACKRSLEAAWEAASAAKKEKSFAAALAECAARILLKTEDHEASETWIRRAVDTGSAGEDLYARRLAALREAWSTKGDGPFWEFVRKDIAGRPGRSGLPLLVADAHRMMSETKSSAADAEAYLSKPEVKKEVTAAVGAVLSWRPMDRDVRVRCAMVAAAAGRHEEAYEHLEALAGRPWLAPFGGSRAKFDEFVGRVVKSAGKPELKWRLAASPEPAAPAGM